MALDASELTAMRDALVRARFAGTLECTIGGRTVRYRSDAEMRRALDDLERRIAEAGGSPAVSQIRFATSKGL